MTVKNGVSIAYVVTPEEGITLAKETIYKELTPQTLLLLSGGNTPKSLYQQLAQEKKLICSAVGMVDERYGKPYHDSSNEKMIEQTGLISYLNASNIPFYNVLENKPIEQTTQDYEKLLLFLYEKCVHRVAIMGIGKDGHIAGIPAANSNFQYPISNTKLVEHFNIQDMYANGWGERVTTTFKSLEQLSTHIILAFGQDKKEALQKMFEEGSEEELPARFFARPEVAKKTLLITDQTV